MSEISVFRMLADLFPARERWLLSGVLGTGVVAAFFETAGVASILPFMALVLDPSAIERYPVLQSMARSVGASSPRGDLLFLGLITVGIVALGSAAAALNVLVRERFAARTRIRLSTALFEGYLRQPYVFHVHRDAPSLIKVILEDAVIAEMYVISSFVLAISRAFMAAGVLILLLAVDPVLAVAVAVVLGTAYFGVFQLVRERQQKLGVQSNESTLDCHRITQEGLGGVKELQVLGREGYAIDRFAEAVSRTARNRASISTLAELPRYALEAIAFGGILLITLAVMAGAEDSHRTLVPVLALYAFAGYRLLPALQQIFSAAVRIRFFMPVLRGLHSDFTLVTHNALRPTSRPPQPAIHFANEIRLHKVSFTYRDGTTPALRDVSLVMRPNESIGLVGRTGAGKTTLADMILGFYEPSSGSISVDGVPLVGPAIRAWRRRVGYVPQQVFLANASVAENIAFGLSSLEIDMEAVYRAARLAQAEEFVVRLPTGFNSVVGERGVKLSGGQRHRIGIARALYHKPEVLVFDEATSALDGLTEDAVMEAVRSLSGECTVILIAHRLRTVEACDRIVMLEGGRIVAEGSYPELLRSSQDFNRLIGRSVARETA